MQNDTIRVVVCGDEGVGKSSLITSLVKDAFVPNLESVLPPITVPRQVVSLTAGESTAGNGLSSNSNALPSSTIVVDTSSLLEERANLTKEIRRATVIWLVYSDHYTCERISLFWMPFFRSLGVNLPIVLTANKCDLQPKEEAARAIADEMVPIMKEFKEIESCIRCSASIHFNVNQAFYLCQRAVTHPLAPLFDSKEGKLKPAAVAALERVFFLSDRDQDGFLSDNELHQLQMKCFGTNLDSTEIEQIASELNDLSTPSSSSPVANGHPVSTIKALPPFVAGKGLTSDGFILLNKIFAEKGRHETTWGILRRFHYTDSLSLEDKFLCPRLEVPPNSSVELSPDGYRFLVDLFLLFDKDNDGGLNQLELDALFKPTVGIPRLWKETNFPLSTVRNESGDVTLQGWLAQWSMTTYLDYRSTMSYLAQLGFESNLETQKITDGVKVTKPRKKRNPASKSYRSTAITDRNVFNCFVLGSSGSGKSTLLNAFLNRPFSNVYTPTIKPVSVVNSVEMPGGKQCYVVLEELGELEPAVLENSSRLDECDVLCYTYDSSEPESFSHLVNLRQKYPQLDKLPAVYVALKADLDRQQQRCDVQPDVYTRNLSMDAPLHVSAQWPSSLNELFVQLAQAAQFPGPATPQEGPVENDYSYMPTVIGASAVGALAVVFLVWRGQQLRT